MITNVCIAGGGVMGSQVAWQSATHDKKVVVYDAFEEGLARSQTFHHEFAERFVKQNRMSKDEAEAAKARISYTTDLAKATTNADLLIEQVPEDLRIKQRFWQNVSTVAPQKTIFCTNTSSLLPSDIVSFVDRPEKFLTLHFCVDVWDANIGEIMGQKETKQEYFDKVVEYAREIGLEPIKLKREQAGYVLNSMLIPWLIAAINLLREGVSSAEDIDKTWMISNHSKMGPLKILDMVGMQAAYHISKSWAETYNDKQAAFVSDYIKTTYLDKGRLGLSVGKGIYDY